MKFEIHKLARIEDATFEIKDLTIFVGKNSTNKSYAAHVVYMLNKVLSQINNKNIKNSLFNEYLKLQDIQDVIDELKTINKKEVIITNDENEFLWAEKREVTYNLDKIDLTNIEKTIKSFLLSYILNELNKSFTSNIKVLKKIIINKFDTNPILSNIKTFKIQNEIEEQDHYVLLFNLFDIVLYNLYKNNIRKDGYYFPASRTGFVLTFDEIVSGVLRDRFGGQPTATKLTQPTIDFISEFSDIKSGKFDDKIIAPSLFDIDFSSNPDEFKNKKISLFEFIENRIIKGKIVEEKQQQTYTNFYLQPSKSNKLELHLTSSATVELLPLIIFLKHFLTLEDKLLVIEEPEAHLHPQAQIEMARLLVMLVNAGAKVLITTHSDYILNEISNCIKLAEASDKSVDSYLKKHKLSKEIIINKERVSSYLFKDVNNTTEVKNLTIDKYGIANDNFDDVLDELLDRTEEINEIIED